MENDERIRAKLKQRIETARIGKADAKSVIDTLSNHIEALTEEMFATANEKVATAEMLRADAEETQRIAEEKREQVENQMDELTKEMEHLKDLLGEGAIDNVSENPKDGAENQSLLVNASFWELRSFEYKISETEVEEILWSEFMGLMGASGDMQAMLETEYWRRCLREDIEPCWVEIGIQQSGTLLDLVATNDLVIRSAGPKYGEEVWNCALTNQLSVCGCEFKSDRKSSTIFKEFAPISNRAFMALSVVADLVSTLRYLNRGIIDTRPVSVYPILCELRMHIAAVRMGWTREDSGQKSQL